MKRRHILEGDENRGSDEKTGHSGGKGVVAASQAVGGARGGGAV